MDELFFLDVRDYVGPARWRWVLSSLGGEMLCDHQVMLDESCWQYEAFADLPGYLRWHVVPDRRIQDEAVILAAASEWIGEQVLGPIGAVLAATAPATVLVRVPEQAVHLTFRPLQLAHVNGRPLASQNVTLITQAGGDSSPPSVHGDERPEDVLRVLGLFSMPAGERPLNLRRERQALVKLFTGIAAMGRAVDVRVLQYGVTRGKLQEVLTEGGGWDIIHVSGHGAPGELLLETENGSPDAVAGGELAALLALTRERLKLVTVSACWSAALGGAAQRRLLGLPVSEAQLEDQIDPSGGLAPGVIATDLAALGCAVLAMRYPVTDDFAIALAEKLYRLLAAENQLLPRALGMALEQVVAVPPTSACPGLSVATPALFGNRAVGLRLAMPERTGSVAYDTAGTKMAGFPPQPDRLVGRTAVMAQASAALAPGSRRPAILLHGMPGAGKTACAAELAHTHEHAFDRLLWFKAPDEGHDISSALVQFALTLERGLPDVQMVHVLDDASWLAGFLPHLTQVCELQRALVVIDNIESLLSDRGQWRDHRWPEVIAAMCGHTGQTRVLLTSRRVPVGLDGRTLRLAVNALSLDEALLLARELPHLRSLMDGSLPGLEAGVARRLATGVLNIAQGHPTLLELANAQAADPAVLSALVEAADHAWQQAGGVPSGFFTTGQTRAAEQDYEQVMVTWTLAVAESLTQGDKDIFSYLCCLEEGDRDSAVAGFNWAAIWARLGRDGHPPDLIAGLAALAASGLITVDAKTALVHQLGGEEVTVAYETHQACSVHPLVAQIGRVHAGAGFQDAVDSILGKYWMGAVGSAQHLQETGQASRVRAPAGEWVVRGGLSAIPYLRRLRQWEDIAAVVEIVFTHNSSPATVAAVMPAMQQVSAAVSGTAADPKVIRSLNVALGAVDPAGAAEQSRSLMTAAAARDDYLDAAIQAEDLFSYCLRRGRLTEALELAEKVVDYMQRAGLGPWTKLRAEARRLLTLAKMGQAEHALAEIQRLRGYMATLPDISQQQEMAIQSNVRHILLDAGREAAERAARWQEMLELNAELVTSMRDQGAQTSEILRAKFADYAPLLSLGRTDEALELLVTCRRVAEQDKDIQWLGTVFDALSEVENARGRGDAAISLERDALRYKYLDGDVRFIEVSHYRLGNYLTKYARQPDVAVAHHLAAALISSLTGSEGFNSVSQATRDLRLICEDFAMPADVEELCRRVDADVPAAHLRRLLTTLGLDQTVQEELEKLQAHITTLYNQRSFPRAPNLPAWEPVIAAMTVARCGGRNAAAALDRDFARCENSADWGALVSALRQLRTNERETIDRVLDAWSSDEQLPGLDDTDTFIMTAAAMALDGRISIPAWLWAGIPIRWLLDSVVIGAQGDSAKATRSQQQLDELAGVPEYLALASALKRILGGERDPRLASDLESEYDRAIVEMVLYYIEDTSEAKTP